MRSPLPPAAAAFAVGAVVMALELLLPRLVAPDVGTSVVTWTSTFAVVLGGIAIGNRIGGRVADARTGGRLDAVALLAAAAAVAAVPLLARPVAAVLAPLPLLPRALLSISAIALPATVALGAVPPVLAARALRGTRAPGRTLGRLSAAGALGSLSGTYATGYLLVPRFATTPSIAVLAGALAVAALLAAAGPRAARGVATPSGAPAAPRAPERARLSDPLPASRAAALALATGAALLVLEVVAARTASRIVGDGIYTWTAVVGSVLLGLALGAAVGGRLAERASRTRTLGVLLLVASALLLASAWTPALLHGLSRGSGAGFPWRVALGAALAWVPASAALGAIPPVLARAALRGSGEDGRVVGAIYAAQTVGCVVGSVATSPVLVPLLNEGGALAAAALLLALLAPLVGRRVEWPWVAALAATLAAAVLPFPLARGVGQRLGVRSDADAVLARESAYGQVRVDTAPEFAALGRPRLRRLVIDGFVHGYADLDDPEWLGYGYEGIYAAVTERVAPRDRPPRAFFVGGGAGTFPRWLLRHRPGAEIDVAEIDPVVTWSAQEALGLERPLPFRVAHEDARTFVRDRPSGAPPYDLVYGDAFDDLSVPWHLTTLEFARGLKRSMAPDAVYLVNLIDAVGSGRFLGTFAATLREVFAHVTLLGLGPPGEREETFVLVASDRALDLADLARPDPRSRDPKATLPVLLWHDRDLEGFVRRADGRILTDDRAPVEALLAPVVRFRSGR